MGTSLVIGWVGSRGFGNGFFKESCQGWMVHLVALYPRVEFYGETSCTVCDSCGGGGSRWMYSVYFLPQQMWWFWMSFGHLCGQIPGRETACEARCSGMPFTYICGNTDWLRGQKAGMTDSCAHRLQTNYLS
jgi:hypothetical protein